MTPQPSTIAPESMNYAQISDAIAREVMKWTRLTPEDPHGDVWMDGENGMYRVWDWNPVINQQHFDHAGLRCSDKTIASRYAACVAALKSVRSPKP